MQPYLEQQANTIEAVLAEQGLSGRVVGGTLSPRLIHFQLTLAPAVRLSRLTPALPALAERLGVEAVRLAPDAETGAPTLEVPRPDPVPVRLLPLARRVAAIAPACTATLGADVTGAPLLLRLDAPEVGPVLVCGEPDAGKSVLLRGMALSLALHNGPDTLRLLLIDASGPGRRAARHSPWSECSGLPHLIGDVVREPLEAKLRLRWAARLAAGRGEQAVEGEPILGPNLVILIDGLDALLAGRDGAEMAAVLRTIASGRDLGVHLVATATNPALGELLDWGARLVGRLPDARAAVVAAGVRGTGAEGLLGRGDFLALLGGDVLRFQAGFATAGEAARTATLLRACAEPAAPLAEQPVHAKARRSGLRLLQAGSGRRSA